MQEHIRVGKEYPDIDLNTSYSFGLDDQEFVVAFETDEPARFLDLVQRLRTTEASAYTKRDTPTFTCVATSVERALSALDGTPLSEPSRRVSEAHGMRRRRPWPSSPRCALALAGCGGGDDGGGDAAPEDPVAQVPSGLQEKVRAARDPQASEFPKAGGKTLQALADSIGGGPEMGLAGSIFLAGQENRVAFGVIDQDGRLPLRQDRALLRARRPRSPAKGPFVAPADVLVTDAPYRSEQAATEADPFAAVYAAQVPFKAPASTR